ncbi:Valyl-tRNA synthetase [Desulfatibacillum aliphaticivorans]|uniref:Valine--tRNA ligase n=1 Tax=Desulfatibacillum aliphaticivorans TaxID=218208 RepID=B8FHB6_DESAL|nr:valine--tRNA ligase [Desulfatibacillum aliphaticivorans]ACL02204.1 Valyl-tRNA synthetase [Desulfatibacillum aliphaticivorans]
MDSKLDKGYEPHDVEAHWYAFWESEGLFAAKEEGGDNTYSIVIPPPNVTGVLHMGHALNVTLQDILCRYRRSKGDNVLWMPGTDHAGIATQNVVERQLASEGTDRHQVGREAFIERVWEWRKQYGGAIINQLKRLGASCDWDRERFTMDEGLSRAVRKVFVDLYDQGLIYRGDYIINWCPRCHTALADLEVEHEQTDGKLYQILYPFVDGEGGLIVATTRPETMLGDTAVAINPEDERYADLTAEKVMLPIMNREIPIVKDAYVDLKFGTGALKVTPAHDVNDFEIGLRHDLSRVKVIGEDGCMTAEAGEFEGMERFECRKAIVAKLDEMGLLKKVESHDHGVGQCYRCKTTVEPNLSKQWFVKAGPLAEKAIKAVETKKTRIVPEVWEKTYFEWLYNIRDWCISRQIWWGHRIPAWTCQDCGEIMVRMEDPDKCTCGSTNLEQESDVLDTWFSSALWPFSTMGWPDQTQLLKAYYPTSVLITGFDILFFWVARMMMMGLQFMDDVPFKDVYIHALVRDEEGKKMSKSKGNVIDPLEVIESQGTDAFRFTLASFAAMGRDIKLSVKRIEGYRHFINKLWNAARFTLTNVENNPDAAAKASKSRAIPDRWILSRLNQVILQVEESLEAYQFNEAANILYKFVWHEFCDWYLEAIKPILYREGAQEERNATVATLQRVLKDAIVLLHPFIPFVTEEIWHHMPGAEGSIMKAPYPAAVDEAVGLGPDKEAEREMELVMAVVTAVRNIRGEMNIPPNQALAAIIEPTDDFAKEALARESGLVSNLARLSSLEVGGKRPKGAATAVVDGASVYVLLEGVIDLDKEEARLEKEIAKLTKELVKLDKKLNNEDFLAKAPDKVVEKVRGQQAEMTEKREHLESNLEKVREIHGDQG